MHSEEIEELFKRYEHVTKGSHFVKREYLAEWSRDGKQILTSLKGDKFSPNSLQDVCTKRYMYKMEKLTEVELLQLRYMYRDSPPLVKKINDDFLNYWQLACSITDGSNSPEIKELANKMKIQTGENIQTIFESSFLPEIKEELLNCKEDFVGNSDHLFHFGLYLFSQYLRTKRQRDKIINSYQSAVEEGHIDIGLDPAKLWNPLITILTNMAAYTLIGKDNLHIKFIKSSKRELLTSDQPILNIAEDINNDYFRFYYPLRPSLGIVFPCDKYELVEDNRELIEKMNKSIIEKSDIFVFKY